MAIRSTALARARQSGVMQMGLRIEDWRAAEVKKASRLALCARLTPVAEDVEQPPPVQESDDESRGCRCCRMMNEELRCSLHRRCLTLV